MQIPKMLARFGVAASVSEWLAVRSLTLAATEPESV
jgi:hypothetical protein